MEAARSSETQVIYVRVDAASNQGRQASKWLVSIRSSNKIQEIERGKEQR